MSDDALFQERLAALGAVTLAALEFGEWLQRRLGPEAGGLRAQGAPILERLRSALPALQAVSAPEGLAPLREDLVAVASSAGRALEGIVEPDPAQLVPQILAAMREHARAQELAYPLRRVFPPFGRFFALPDRYPDLAALDPEPAEGASVGLHRAGDPSEARGGFVLYIPEWYRPDRRWPLVVALHGGMGHGAGFVWTWLREARSRGALLLAPTSLGDTWSLLRPSQDAGQLRRMVAFVGERWSLDPERVLLTGLSDGATFTLLAGLEEASPYTALAPVSGVLHPLNSVNGNLERARGRRIHLVHGAQDWMFPVALARAARDVLAGAGAELVYDEVEDLSHAYPRERNERILGWFDPSLAPPPGSGGPQSNG